MGNVNPDTEKKWSNIYTLWKNSGLNQRKWCQLNNISYNSFHWAVTKYGLIKKKTLKEQVISIFPDAKKIFLHKSQMDIHRSFDKLLCFVSDSVPDDLIYSSYFIFLSRRRTYLKIFYVDEDGPNILFKRLERGAFKKEQSGQELGDFFIL